MSDALTIYNEGEKLRDEGKYEEAIAKFKEAIEADEGHVLSHLALAVEYGKVGKHEDAVRHGQRACELESTDAFNFTALSVTFQRAFAGTQNHVYIQMAEDAMAKAHSMQSGFC